MCVGKNGTAKAERRELLSGYGLWGSFERGICVKFMENYALN
jgi:hypothetical protein